MAKVPLRSGLLADVTNSEIDHVLMKSFISKSNGISLEHDKSSHPLVAEDVAAFSPRTDLANKLSHTSLISDEQTDVELSNSPPACTPNRRSVTQAANADDRQIKSKRIVAANVGRMSPLVIADEQTKYPELDDSLSASQRSTSSDSFQSWGRRRSSTFTELSTDSGFGSSSLQSWADQRSGASSAFSPSSTRQLAVINELSNFAFSPCLSVPEGSRDSFSSDLASSSANISPCPITPQHRLIALRSRSRESPLTPKQSTQHCSPSPSLPNHIQALVRGGFRKVESTTSPTATKKPLEKHNLFVGASEKLSRSNSLKRVATTDCLESSFSQTEDRNSTQNRSNGLSPFGEAKKLRSQLESIKEGVCFRNKPTESRSQPASLVSTIATPLQKSICSVSQNLIENCTPLSSTSTVSSSTSTSASSSVTVTTTAPNSSVQAPPDTCMIGDGSRPYLLPCRPHESTVLIDCAELANLLAGKYAGQVKNFHIIDCRYPYEHAGGHIKGAVNHPKAEPLLKEFFDSDMSPSSPPDADTKPTKAASDSDKQRTLLIFHCEFSSKRAPDMVKQFRKCDRHRNRHNYPSLDYPEVYMLAGGYKAFYEYCCATNQQHLLEPHGGYTPMHAEEHNHELRRWKKYKTMSAVEDRLVKNVVGQSISPLSTSCTNNDSASRLSCSQQETGSNPVGSGPDEQNRPYRVARRNPLVRRQLSSFSVPSHQPAVTSPLVKRSESSKLIEKATPLCSQSMARQQPDEDAENRPPVSSPNHW